MNRTTLGAKSNKRCDRLNIFKTITVQKNPIVLTGCKRFSDITFLSSQISTFGMVIVCTGTDHRRRSVEIFVELSFQCSLQGDGIIQYLGPSLYWKLISGPNMRVFGGPWPKWFVPWRESLRFLLFFRMPIERLLLDFPIFSRAKTAKFWTSAAVLLA